MKLVIEADGGSRGNPGVAGSGTVVYASDHKQVLRSIAYAVGRATNNVAEYHGLLRGLEAAREMGATEVDVYMDSKLVVEQMSGRWKMKNPDMRQLGQSALTLVRTEFKRVTFTWVPRAKNKLADDLANQAMDALSSGAPVGIVSDEIAEGAAALRGPETAAAQKRPREQPKPASAAAQARSERSPVVGNDGVRGASESESRTAEERDFSADLHSSDPDQWRDRVSSTRLILLRHGQSTQSALHQYSGRSNPELTAVGKQQAVAAATYLAAAGGIDAIVSSPLTRAWDTARACAEELSLPIEPRDGLIEADFGEWEGLTFDQARKRDRALFEQWQLKASVSPPGGESLQDVHRRVTAERKKLVRAYPGQTVLVITHMAVIKSLLRQALGAGTEVFYQLFLDVGGLSRVEFRADGTSQVRSINETGYLL